MWRATALPVPSAIELPNRTRALEIAPERGVVAKKGPAVFS
jgi:hypothetical protein